MLHTRFIWHLLTTLDILLNEFTLQRLWSDYLISPCVSSLGQGVCFSHRGLILWQRFLSSMVSNNSAFMSILTGDTTLSHGLTRRQGLRDQQSRPLLAMTLSRKGSVDFCIGSRYSLGCNTHHLHCHSRLNKYMVTRARKFL